MGLDPALADKALDDIDDAQARARAHRDYAAAGPALVVWGGVLLCANFIAWAFPAHAGSAWGLGIVIGVIASIAAGRKGRSGRSQPSRRRLIVRSLIAALIIAALLSVTLSAAGDSLDQRTLTVILSLIVAGCYALAGLWVGARFLWLGLALAAAILGGWMVLDDTLELWLGLVCGGLLIVTGLWFRRA